VLHTFQLVEFQQLHFNIIPSATDIASGQKRISARHVIANQLTNRLEMGSAHVDVSLSNIEMSQFPMHASSLPLNNYVARRKISARARVVDKY